MIFLFGFLISILICFLNPNFVTFFASIVFLIVLFLGVKEQTIFNPFLLFSMTPLSLMAYNPSVSTYFLMELQPEAFAVIMLGIFFFVIGLWIVRRKQVQVRHVKRSFWLLLILGTIPNLLSIALAGIPLFASGQEEIEAIRESYSIPIISQLSIFLPVSIICAFKEQKLFKIILSISFGLFFAIITVSKFTILFTLMFVAFAIMKYRRKKLSPMVKLGVGITFISFPLIFGVVHDKRSDLEQSEYQWRQQVSSGVDAIEAYGDFLYLPYLYATSPWSNLAYNVEVQEKFQYGAMTGKPIISLFQLDKFFPPYEKPIYQFPMNTHAFMTDFYLDFGVLGVIFLSFFLGVLVKYTYLNSLLQNDVLLDGLWVAFGFATFMMFFSNHFTSVGYPLVIFVIFSVYILISRTLKKSFYKMNILFKQERLKQS